MEAAAVAWACEQHGTPLFCIKVVTDIVDGDGVGEVSTSPFAQNGLAVRWTWPEGAVSTSVTWSNGV